MENKKNIKRKKNGRRRSWVGGDAVLVGVPDNVAFQSASRLAGWADKLKIKKFTCWSVLAKSFRWFGVAVIATTLGDGPAVVLAAVGGPCFGVYTLGARCSCPLCSLGMRWARVCCIVVVCSLVVVVCWLVGGGRIKI